METEQNQAPQEMKTAIKKAELLGKLSARLQVRIGEATKAFKRWQNARDINLQAPVEFAEYMRALRSCHRLQRAERRLAE